MYALSLPLSLSRTLFQNVLYDVLYNVLFYHFTQGLATALEAMQDVAKYINEVKRDNETINTILEIQRSITDINMPPNTYLTDYGKLQVCINHLIMASFFRAKLICMYLRTLD